MADAEIFLSVSDVAALLGIAPQTVSQYRLPPADALIGRTRGWRRETIDSWVAARPGSGRWGKNDPRTNDHFST